MMRSMLLALALAASAHAAAHDAPPDRSAPVRRATHDEDVRGRKLFREKIRPMLVAHCLDCHGGRKTRGDFDCRVREGYFVKAHKSIPVIPFNSAESRLTAMIERHGKPAMPPKSTLTPEQVADFRAWIDCGAPFDGPVKERAAGAW